MPVQWPADVNFTCASNRRSLSVLETSRFGPEVGSDTLEAEGNFRFAKVRITHLMGRFT